MQRTCGRYGSIEIELKENGHSQSGWGEWRPFLWATLPQQPEPGGKAPGLKAPGFKAPGFKAPGFKAIFTQWPNLGITTSGPSHQAMGPKRTFCHRLTSGISHKYGN